MSQVLTCDSWLLTSRTTGSIALFYREIAYDKEDYHRLWLGPVNGLVRICALTLGRLTELHCRPAKVLGVRVSY